MTLDPAVAATLRGALALLLVASAAHKLRDFAAFRAALSAYRLVPERLVVAAAALVACAELVIGGALATGASAGAALSAAFLFAGYAAAIAVNLARGRRDLDCGCLGPGAGQPLHPWLVARNLALVAAALACRLPATERELGGIDALTIGAGVATLAALWLAVHGLAANEARLAALRT
jgi:hypothetical protein